MHLSLVLSLNPEEKLKMKALAWFRQLAQPVKASTAKPADLSLEEPHGGRGEPSPACCSLSSTLVPWHMCTYTHRIKKYKIKEPGNGGACL